METSYTQWDCEGQVNILMQGEKKAKDSQGCSMSKFIKMKVVIFCVTLGIGFLLITALLSQSLRNESDMSKAIQGRNDRSSDVSAQIFNMSKEVTGIHLKVDDLQAESRNLQESIGLDMTKAIQVRNARTSDLSSQILNLSKEVTGIHLKVDNLQAESRNLQESVAAQMTKVNSIPSLLKEVAKLTEENRRMAVDVTQVLGGIHNLTNRLCMKCPPNWLSFGKSCYFFSTASKPWMVAKHSCETEGAHLAIINSQPEMKFLVSQMIPDQAFWIGLNDAGKEGHWIWEDGTPMTFSYWAKGEPNNAGNDGEDCAAQYSNGKWNDYFCTGNVKWICEQKC